MSSRLAIAMRLMGSTKKPFTKNQAMTKHPVTLIAGLGLSLGAVAPVTAEPLVLSFETTIDIAPFETVFGRSGAGIPLFWSITYDADLAPVIFVPQGTLLGEGRTEVTAHDYYGYDAAGIIATNLSFGTMTFTAADFDNTVIGGYSAPAAGNLRQKAMWLDTDISVAVPTRVAIRLFGAGFNDACVGGTFCCAGGGGVSLDEGRIFMTDGIADIPGIAESSGEFRFWVLPQPSETLGSISTVSRTPQGIRMTTSPVLGRDIGIEYSENLEPGSWIDLGNFYREHRVMVFIDPDPIRRERRSGFYRAFLRPELP